MLTSNRLNDSQNSRRQQDKSNPSAAALSYAQRGLPVFPLHTPLENGRCSCRKPHCDKVGKHPRTLHGLKDATIDEAKIKKWFKIWPNANIGLVTGGESGLAVLDVDLPDGPASLAAMEVQYGPLPPTLEARTGSGGRHLFFKHPGDGVKIGNVQASKLLGQDLDFRGDGGYVVAAPSLHESGERYKFLDENAPPAPLPNSLLNLLTSKAKAAASHATGGQAGAGTILEGERNNTLASLAGSMRRRGMSEDEILAALTVTNQKRCKPPLPEEEVKGIARSIARFAPQVEHAEEPESLPHDKEDALAFIRDTLGLKGLQELPKRGDVYEMKVNGQLFPIGDVNALMSPRLLRNAIYDALGLVIPKLKPKEYENLMRVWAIVKTDVPTITDDQVTLDWLSDYRDDCLRHEPVDLTSNEDDARSIAVAAILFIKQQSERVDFVTGKARGGFVDTDGVWHLRLESFKRFVRMSFDTFVTEKDLGKRLSRLGFVRREIERTDAEGNNARCTVWISPPNFQAN